VRGGRAKAVTRGVGNNELSLIGGPLVSKKRKKVEKSCPPLKIQGELPVRESVRKGKPR